MVSSCAKAQKVKIHSERAAQFQASKRNWTGENVTPVFKLINKKIKNIFYCSPSVFAQAGQQ
jgi:hypothetical protein